MAMNNSGNWNPSEWSDSFVKYNERECRDTLEQINGSMKHYVNNRDYRSACICCNGICDGLSRMAKYKPNEYAPLLYAYSYILAEVLLFGVGGSTGFRAAIPPLKDALDFARDCARPGRRTEERARRDAVKIEKMLKDLERGVSVDTVRRTYCPDFPRDILEA